MLALYHMTQQLFPDDNILVTQNFTIGQDYEVSIPGFYIVGAKDISQRSIADFSDDQLIELA